MSLKARGKVHPDAAMASSNDGSAMQPPLSHATSTAHLLSRSASSKQPLSHSTSIRSQRSLRRAVSGMQRTMEEENGLLLPDEEHREFLERKVRLEGRQGVKSLLRLYLLLLGPIALISGWMFGIYAILSYSIPNLLCNKVAKENSGGTFSLLDCMNNNVGSQGGYSLRWGAKLFWVVFWSLQQGWMPAFTGLVSIAMFGPAVTKRQRLAIGVVTLLVACISPIAGPRFGLSLNHMGVIAGTVLGGLIVTIITTNSVVRYTRNPVMRPRWFMLFQVAGTTTTLYFFFMPLLITLRAKEAMGGLGLTFFRVVVHPAIWSSLLMMFRFVLRHIGFVTEMMTTIFLTWPLIYASLYGRFLLLQLDNVGSVIVINLLFACVDLASRMVGRGSDEVVLKLMYGARAKDVLTALREQDDKRMTEVFTRAMMETASILSASAILSFGGVAASPGVPPDHAAIWTNALLQVVTTLVFELLGLALEGKFHSFEWHRSFLPTWKPFLTYLLVLVTLGGSRLCVELIGLFCPVYYPDTGKILLEQCDKPSLFQAITFSSAQRYKMIGDFSNSTSINS